MRRKSIASSIFSKKTKRMDQNDWAQMMFSYQGNSYPLGASMSRGAKYETIENDFAGFVNGAFKGSGTVFAGMTAIQLIFTEARFQYQQLNKGRPGDLFGSQELTVLEKPWPNASTGDLLARAFQDAYLAGNHYVVREGVGPGSRLRRLRPDWVDIILSAPVDEAVRSDVVGYLYRPGGTDDQDLWEVFPVDGSNGAIAHWAPFPDPAAQYRGISPLSSVVDDILMEKAATKHKAKFFQNAATPNIAVAFKETVTEDQFKEFMEQMDATKHGVEHAYETLYLGGGADVTVIGANVQQMDFRTTLGHSETRIAAALRVHPTIVGLAEGMHGSTLNEGNFKAAKNQFADGTLRPLWRTLSAAYAVLVPEFDSARLWYDDRDIAFLRQDRLEQAQILEINAQTLSAYLQSGWTADSSLAALVHKDESLLEHTGMFSVQLLPPGTIAGNAADGSTAPPKTPNAKGKPSTKKPAGPPDA